MATPEIPTVQTSCYSAVFVLENALREFIVEELSTTFGERWYKQHLPSHVLEKFRESISVERKVKWLQLVPHHPIYYVDFPDLRKVISRKDNWERAFRGIFGRWDVFDSSLAGVEPIRNRLAHNRKVSESDLRVAEAALSQFSSAVGKDRLEELTRRCTALESISENLRTIRETIFQTAQECRSAKLALSAKKWEVFAACWWLDEEYLGNPVDAIFSYFELVSQYSTLPRIRGEGFRIEAWLAAAGLEERYRLATLQASALLES